MTAAIFICAILTAACLLYIFYLPGKLYLGPKKTRLSYLRERKEVVYENLRDLNFEYRAGKVGELDHESLRTSLEEEAAAILSEIARLEESERNPLSEIPTRKGARV
jgi:hypothetical protein